MGVTPDPRRRRTRKRGEAKNSPSPLRLHLQMLIMACRETCSREGPIFNALAARYQKEARYRGLPAADDVVEARGSISSASKIVSVTGTNLSSESSGPACPASARIV